MAPVAGVDHVHMPAAARAVDVLRDQERRAALGVAHDEHVGVHRDQVVDRVEQRFALRRGRRADVQVDHVGRQPLGGDLEGGARARRALEEQVEHRLAAQQRHLLDVAVGHADEGGGRVEDVVDQLARQPLDGEQVPQLPVLVQLGMAQRHGVIRSGA